MSEFSLTRMARGDPNAVKKYCTALGWDYDRLMSALSTIGLSHKNTSLERPNEVLISILAEFLTVAGSSIFVVTGANGEGKSGLKEFCMRVFTEDGSFLSFSIDNPGPFTPLQLMKTIAMNLSEKPVPRTKERLMAEIEHELIEYRQSGKTVLIWVDEGQKLDIHRIALLRALADIKTPEGLLACKVLIVGTPDLSTHIDRWLESGPTQKRLGRLMIGRPATRCPFDRGLGKTWTSGGDS
jgi:type II secretory pathway predicted ATPase ExeA